MKSFKRSDRVADQLLRDLPDILADELADKKFGLVSFTSVVVSDDLRHAKIFVSTLADGDKRAAALEFLNSRRGHVRSALAQRMTTKSTPEVTFAFDPSIERGLRMEEILNNLARERGEGPK